MKNISVFPSLLISAVFALGWTTESANAAAVDSDGDGVNDYREDKDGTDRQDPNSFNPLSKGLVAYYPLDGNANDESGYGNNGSIEGTVTLAVDRFSSASNSYNFQGSGLISIPHNDSFSISDSNALTVSAWIYRTDDGTSGHILGKRPPGELTYNWQIHFESRVPWTFDFPEGTSFVSGTGVGTNVGCRSGTNPASREWVQVVGIYDHGNWSLYQDGVLVTTGTGSPHPDANTPLQIGSSGGFLPFIGHIDDVRIYNRALSAQEVANLYTSERDTTDSDMDSLYDFLEIAIGTDPNDPDTDNDGLKDGAEYLLADLGFDPSVKNSDIALNLFANPNNASLFTQNQYDTFGAQQFTNGVNSVLNAMPSLEVSAPTSTFFRAGVGSNNATGVTAAILPPGWKFDPASRQIFGRLTGTNPISAQLYAQRGTNAPMPFVFNFTPQIGQIISAFANIPTKTFGNPAPTFAITSPVSSAGLPVTVSIKSGPATIANNMVTLIGAGKVVLAANQDGDGTMTPAPEATKAFTVLRGSQTITFGQLASEPFVPGKTINLTATASSGLATTFRSSKTNVVSVSGSVATITGRGTATITASQPGNTDWNQAPAVNRAIVVY